MKYKRIKLLKSSYFRNQIIKKVSCTELIRVANYELKIKGLK